MNLLFVKEIQKEIQEKNHGCPNWPDFGDALRRHLTAKLCLDARLQSTSAWSLLAEGLSHIGCEALPTVVFLESGKPIFVGSPLCFSLSHSQNLAAVLISDQNCGVDLEEIRPEVAEKLRNRVLSPEEQRQNADFFEIWTQKEALGKLLGTGLCARPAQMDVSALDRLNTLQKTLRDSSGIAYCLTALCQSPDPIQFHFLTGE